MLLTTQVPNAYAEDSADTLIDEVADHWSTKVTTDLSSDVALVDETKKPSEDQKESGEITLAQMLTPQRNLSPRVAQRTSRSLRRSSAAGMASVPFMIGDTGAGTCVSFGGLLIDADLAHPTLTCSRLNISENNTPLPTDRVFFSYRHFRNATPARFFQFSRDFDVNRFTIGGERTFGQGLFSVEVRVPMEGRLSSNMVSQDRSLFGGPTQPFAGGQAAEFGNISGVFKALLHETSTVAVSCGLGVTLPTAQDVTYEVDLLSLVTYPGFPTIFSNRDVLLDFEFKNETAYLSPFLAWLWKPNSRFFHQGFWQIEVGVNPSNLKSGGFGVNDFFDNTTVPATFLARVNSNIQFPGRAQINPQTLMRLNLGMGYVLRDNPHGDWIQRLTGMFEAHYTTTLEDADIDTLQFVDFLPPVLGGGSITTPIPVGNRANQVDIVNLVAGLSANMGNWVVTNGVSVPIRPGDNRGFDFEYNLQVQRPF